MRVASQSLIERRFVKEIKSGIRDKGVSKNVRVLQIIGIIVGIVLLVIGCNGYCKR